MKLAGFELGASAPLFLDAVVNPRPCLESEFNYPLPSVQESS